MNQINCPICGNKCVKAGKTKAGTQRWLCKKCKTSLTHKIDNDSKELQIFLDWLFGKETQSIMPGEGRTFRRKTARFWDIWPMPPKIEETKDVLFLDGIYLGRKACVLICCDEKNVLGWYLCRYEHAGAWIALMKRIAEPRMVVSDGGTGFAKALKKVWPIAKHQRCIFHVFCQIKRYTTSKPNTLAGVELYCLAKDLLKIKEKQEAETWVTRFTEWIKKYQKFLSEMTVDEHGNKRPTHERLLKAERSLLKLIKENTLFTYLDKEFINDFIAPSTNNRIEGGINSDGGTGFAKALKKVWPIAKHQRCIFHVFCQIKRYTTSKPNTLAGVELYCLAKDLLKIKEKQEAETWVTRFTEWIKKYQKFLSEMTVDEHGNKRPTHERLLKAERSLLKLIKENTLFTYLDKEFINDFIAPSTNNRIEGGINSRLREMLRNHRGLSIERRIKAVYWWCYMHSPEPLSLSEIIKTMPTDRSIAAIYQRMNDKSRLEKSLSLWGDAIVWSDLHKMDKSFTEWD